MYSTNNRTKTSTLVKLGIALVLVFCLLISWGVLLVRDKLLVNADEMGTYLAQSYAAEEENRFTVYRSFMGLGASYLNGQIETGADPASLQAWLAEYAENITTVLGTEMIDPYAVIDGEIIAAQPWEGDASYDYASTAWYQGALSSDRIYFSNAYQDAITGSPVVTLAVRLSENGDVLAFDVLLDSFDAHTSELSLPERASYYLFDTQGTLLYCSTTLDIDTERGHEYLKTLRAEVESGSLDNHSSTIQDLNGENRSVYYSWMDNGWLSVITIPTSSILQDGWDTTILTIAAIFGVLLIAMAVFMVRAAVENRRMRHTVDTLKILGDTYYAIYRLNYEAGTYETIKSSPDVREALGKGGTLEHLIEQVKYTVEEDTYEKFEASFNAENIRRLVGEGIHEFGGDYRRKFGDVYRWVSIRIIYNGALNLNEVIMCFREVDGEKRKQLQQLALLESALDSAKQTVDKKSAFFSNVSHDMRTPLNAIIGLSDLAREDVGDQAKTLDYLGKIDQAGRQLLTLVNDILDMSRIEHGEGSALDFTPMDFRASVQDCAALFEEQAQREGKSIQVEVPAEVPQVYCDAFRVSQILNNLTSNALKYSLGGARVTLRLAVVSQQQRMCKLRLEVSDTGVGMSEEFLERVFEPFARETMFAPRNVTGTGLGMPIVKSLVQQMSGEISVKSKLGEGTTFTVILPLQIVEQDELAAQGTGEQDATEAPFDLAGARVLVAEDNEINMIIATEYVRALGGEPLEARNGKEAVDVFKAMDTGEVGAVLMDMQMPEMDGCDACRAIRALDRADAKTVPIIAVTANAFAEDISKTAKAGMNGHVSKPIDLGALTEALRKAMGDGV